MYYLYRHIRLDKNEPFYIGIGTSGKYNTDRSKYSRAYSRTQRNIYWDHIVNITDFEVEILFESESKTWIKEKEIEFIALYKRKLDGGTLCNMTIGGEGANGLKGVPKPAYFSKILSKRNKGNKYGLGKKCSAEKKEAISKGIKQAWKKLSEEEKLIRRHIAKLNKLGKKQKPAKYTEKWKKKKELEKIPVIQYSIDGKQIAEFKSLSEAEKSGPFLISKISNCCNNKRKSHGNFIWKFKKDIQEK